MATALKFLRNIEARIQRKPTGEQKEMYKYCEYNNLEEK